jgi:hypothetical protein
MSTLPFTISIPLDGAVTFPPEFRGKTLKLETVTTESNEKFLKVLQSDASFRQPQSLEQILKMQNAKPIKSIDDLRPDEPVWESEEDFFAFLEAIGENPELYR